MRWQHSSSSSISSSSTRVARLQASLAVGDSRSSRSRTSSQIAPAEQLPQCSPLFSVLSQPSMTSNLQPPSHLAHGPQEAGGSVVIHAPLGAIACHGRLGMPLVFDGCQEGLEVGLLCLQVAEEARPTRSSSPLHVNYSRLAHAWALEWNSRPTLMPLHQ